jgi:hypothetical protein
MTPHGLQACSLALCAIWIVAAIADHDRRAEVRIGHP